MRHVFDGAGLDVVPSHPSELRTVPRRFSPMAIAAMLLLHTPVVVHNTGITNTAFHDFSGFLFNSDMQELLSLSENFAMTPPVDTELSMTFDVYDPFDRSMHLAWHFRDAQPDDTPAVFRVPSTTNFHPRLDLPDYEPPDELMQYLKGVHDATLEATRNAQKTLHNLPRRLRKALNVL